MASLFRLGSWRLFLVALAEEETARAKTSKLGSNGRLKALVWMNSH